MIWTVDWQGNISEIATVRTSTIWSNSGPSLGISSAVMLPTRVIPAWNTTCTDFSGTAVIVGNEVGSWEVMVGNVVGLWEEANSVGDIVGFSDETTGVGN